ncbi:group 1 truncated hemoglobin [Caulobacter sp. RHG1]|uniref:group I truncated hemoglobin n=1 Tax=Caulobacter sp. (strain RHG1) TaxID=2545762 RepID=UPI0015547CD0|nr:group 1 truncated hemoglobin [Caulobacter sp. RHG1]NQE60480.1 Cyanoglobin, Hemoglobin-like protein HbN [Caulobacter sp. RHG1]
MKSFILAGLAAITLSGSAFAQEAVVPPGEKPVDAYKQSNANADATPMTDQKTFEAFHGKEGIDRIVETLVERNFADPRIKDFFAAADKVRLKRTLKEQFCYILGGGCDYTGRNMKDSHKDQGTTNKDMNALIENLQFAMDKEGVPFAAQNKLLAKLAPQQRDIVER